MSRTARLRLLEAAVVVLSSAGTFYLVLATGDLAGERWWAGARCLLAGAGLLTAMRAMLERWGRLRYRQ